MAMDPSDVDTRLPPNQALASAGKWPVVGERAPRASSEPWAVAVDGLVDNPRSWSLAELAAMPQVDRQVDIHCVTRWSRLDARFAGVPLAQLLEACAPRPEARFVSFVARSERDHSTSLPLADLRQLDALVALAHEGQPLDQIHGGPVRMVVPGRYFYKSLKWLARIELLADDRLGYWEGEAGYHNGADPWREQRYIAANLDRREVQRLLASRDLSGRHLLGLQARHLELTSLDARRAQLRNAELMDTQLQRARFDEANLSNAHLERADLRGASFVDADVEGASFVGADLRGADFTGASLFGATFAPEPGEEGSPAVVDGTTGIGQAQLEPLSDVQQAFLRERLGLG